MYLNLFRTYGLIGNPEQDKENNELEQIINGINSRRTERVRDCLTFNTLVKEVEGEITGPLEQIDKITQDFINLFLYY
jgi:hypothetical protein